MHLISTPFWENKYLSYSTTQKEQNPRLLLVLNQTKKCNYSVEPKNTEVNC